MSDSGVLRLEGRVIEDEFGAAAQGGTTKCLLNHSEDLGFLSAMEVVRQRNNMLWLANFKRLIWLLKE